VASSPVPALSAPPTTYLLPPSSERRVLGCNPRR
jgi:hypothetical protein